MIGGVNSWPRPWLCRHQSLRQSSSLQQRLAPICPLPKSLKWPIRRPLISRIVWRLDRLGRSLKDLVQKVEDLQQRQVGFRSLHESIDTTSSVGKFQFHVFSALAEFERNLIRDRTTAGLRAARARGA